MKLHHVAAFALIVALVAKISIPLLTPVDDSYITMRFAENVSRGLGIVYNEGQRVEGTTSIGFMALLAFFGLIGIRRLDIIAMLIGVLAFIATVVLAWRFISRQHKGPLGRPEAFTLAFLCGSLSIWVWTWSGMETPLLILAYLGAFLIHLHEQERERGFPWASALVTVGAGMLHPDGILIAAPLFLSWLIPFNRRRAVRGFFYGFLSTILFGVFWAARWAYFGFPMPNTYYAKMSNAGFGLIRLGIIYFLVFYIATLVPFFATVFGIELRKHWRTWPRWIWLAFGMAAANTAGVVSMGGDFYPFHRFMMPSLPLITLVFWKFYRDRTGLRPAKISKRVGKQVQAPATAQNQTGQKISVPYSFNKGLAKSFLVVILMNVFAFVWTIQGIMFDALQKVVKDFTVTGRAFSELMPNDHTVATLPIGAFGFFSGLPILDMAGLVEVSIAHRPLPTGHHLVGHEKVDHAYILSFCPEVVLLNPGLYRRGDKGLLEWMSENSNSTWQYTLLEEPELHESYKLCFVPVTHEKGCIGFLRKDLVGTEGYAKWQPFSEEAEDFAYTIPWIARAKPTHNRRFGAWIF